MSNRSIYAARDRLGRTPIVLGRKKDACAVTLETCALSNRGYEVDRYLGPGEIVRFDADGVETLQPPGERMQVCSFLWVYYGYPASSYEGINVEIARNRCGRALARADDAEIDLVSAIGLPKEKLCTYCWDGAETCATCPSRTTAKETLPLRAK